MYIYIYIPYASEASFCKASTLFETKGPKSGPSIALPKCLPPVAMMAQKFHQELFLGVSGFQYDIYYRNLQNKKQWFINGQNCKVRNYVWLFHEFRKRKNTYIYVVYVVKKENMSRGMAVEKPWKGLQMPWKGLKKAWKSLNKAWKGFPNIFFCWLCWIWNHGTKPNDSDLQFSYLWVDSAQDPV